MKKLFKILGGFLAVILLLFIIFSAWYVIKFYPRHAEDQEFGNPEFSKRVIIATQGSDYKNEVVQRLADRLSAHPVYIKVTDVSNLDFVVPEAWSNIVILNTSIADRMNSHARQFLDMVGPTDKIIVITTSGGGDFTPPNLEVDGITTASRLSETEAMVKRIFQFIRSGKA
ncbi:MAG: hypothetical protein HOD43_06390 [Candidatus Marinimicrobia bacterium]|jgi:hypothetical protein|nr:hypothetical protein [Candidatus Neomarinimicrobiota bacterium]MBT3630506.1 hypothetical protein [Candidatus Neomarinimicrobiota bacterium]MBT3823418.1 hypothetical protein [Candidatus Neomarinimicrobiota bacterium]MBT4131753.1 hypothetical protein [Candidatus Neomarinimicrobiota bacterium]MBT4295421.1 hypothetical protein [Candidatus Neomarinimicrobiota bacterium]